MEYVELGKSGIMASRVGLGTFEIGGSSWWDPVDRSQSKRTIEFALNAGINFIDTAPVYGFGESERIVGEVIRSNRQNVVLSTKIGEEFSGHNEGRFHYNHDGRSIYTCLKPASIRRQLDASLKNLNTDYVDILSPHFYFEDKAVGLVDDIWDSLNRLVECGKVRSLGFSNISPASFRKFTSLGGAVVSCAQLYTNVLDYSLIDVEMVDECLFSGVSGIGINGLAKGILSGAFPDSYIVAEGSERSESAWFSGGRLARVNAMIRKWSPILDFYQVSPAALALSWVLKQRAMTHVLIGATEPEHIRQANAAASLDLDHRHMTEMSEWANVLRTIEVDRVISTEARFVADLINDDTPIVIWGAGVTLDYICRRIPIHKCNIKGVYDSQEKLHGDRRFGKKIEPLESIKHAPKDSTLIVTIPQDARKLENILKTNNIEIRTVRHLGHLKALCK